MHRAEGWRVQRCAIVLVSHGTVGSGVFSLLRLSSGLAPGPISQAEISSRPRFNVQNRSSAQLFSAPNLRGAESQERVLALLQAEMFELEGRIAETEAALHAATTATGTARRAEEFARDQAMQAESQLAAAQAEADALRAAQAEAKSEVQSESVGAMEAALDRMAALLKQKEAEVISLRQTVNAECQERVLLLAQLQALGMAPSGPAQPGAAPQQPPASAAVAVQGGSHAPNVLKVETPPESPRSVSSSGGAAHWQTGRQQPRQPARRRGAPSSFR